MEKGMQLALKTFNVDEAVYKEFSTYCKKEGISMSKRIDNFLRAELDKVREATISHTSTSNPGEKGVIPRGGSDEHRMSKYC